jgi:hypothetical protein
MAFDDLGQFRLIDKEFGEEARYYVKHDGAFEELQSRIAQLDFRLNDFDVIASLKAKVEEQLRRMAGNVVAIRLVRNNQTQAPPSDGEAVAGIHKLADPDDYSSITGIRLSGASGNII